MRVWNGLRRALVGAGISGTTNRSLRYFHVSLASAPGRHHLGMSAAVGVTTGIGADADVGSAVSVSADVDFGAPVGAGVDAGIGLRVGAGVGAGGVRGG